jgi:hypothetical protein
LVEQDVIVAAAAGGTAHAAAGRGVAGAGRRHARRPAMAEPQRGRDAVPVPSTAERFVPDTNHATERPLAEHLRVRFHAGCLTGALGARDAVQTRECREEDGEHRRDLESSPG